MDKYPTVLFYSQNDRTFRTSFIGFLHEISQKFPVILLAEELPSEIFKLLESKGDFPKLKKVIKLEKYKISRFDWVNQNVFLRKLAKRLIKKFQPDAIFASGFSLFENYLRRDGKEISNSKSFASIGILTCKKFMESTTILIWNNALEKYPHFFPLKFRYFLAWVKKKLGHFRDYIFSPILFFQKPFWGVTGYYDWDYRKMGGIDNYFVFSQENYEMLVKNQVSEKHLCVIPHPLCTASRELMQRVSSSSNLPKMKLGTKTLAVFMDFNYWGLKREDCFPFGDPNFILAQRKLILWKILEILEDWILIIKPHPMVSLGRFEKIKAVLNFPSRIWILQPAAPADNLISICNAILGFPPASTTLYTAAIQCPAKPIFFVDLHYEFCGDFYKDFKGVDYIDTEGKLFDVFQKLKIGTYEKPSEFVFPPENSLSLSEIILSTFRARNLA